MSLAPSFDSLSDFDLLDDAMNELVNEQNTSNNKFVLMLKIKIVDYQIFKTKNS